MWDFVLIRANPCPSLSPIFVPHSGQNLAPFASVPQLGHLVEAGARSIFSPQLGQNFAPTVGVPHLGQLSAVG